MKLEKCDICGKNTLDKEGVCLHCSGLERDMFLAGIFQLIGILMVPAIWIFFIWLYSGDVSSFSETQLKIGWFFPPALAIFFLATNVMLSDRSNKKHLRLKAAKSIGASQKLGELLKIDGEEKYAVFLMKVFGLFVSIMTLAYILMVSFK